MPEPRGVVRPTLDDMLDRVVSLQVSWEVRARGSPPCLGTAIGFLLPVRSESKRDWNVDFTFGVTIRGSNERTKDVRAQSGAVFGKEDK